MDCEPGSRYGAHRSRAQSLAGDSSRAPSAAASSLVTACSDLGGGGGRSARTPPALCERHQPPRVCQRRPCQALHVCRLYIDGFCPRDDADCPWGHAVASADNRAALQAYQLQALSEHDLLWLARALLRHTAPVSTEEYRRELALCDEYAAAARCDRSDCFRLHLCPGLVSGECRSGADCRWSHRVTDPDNVMVLLRLRCADLTEWQVLRRLALRWLDDGEADSASSGGRSQTVAVSLTTEADVASNHNTGRADEDGGRDSGMSRRSSTQPTSTGASDGEDVSPNGDPKAGACGHATESSASPQTLPTASSTKLSGLNGHTIGPTSLALCPDSCSSGDRNRAATTSLTIGAVPAAKRNTGSADGGEVKTSDVPCTSPTQPASSRSSEGADVSPDNAFRRGPYERANCVLQGMVSTASAPKPSALSGNAIGLGSLDLCPQNIVTNLCNDEGCDKLHLCRLFVAGICPYGKQCGKGHAPLASGHNSRVLKQHLLQGISESDLLNGLEFSYLSRYPVTEKERRFAIQVCRPYQSGSCDDSDCGRIHICRKNITGSCDDPSKCGLSHHPGNKSSILKRVGLSGMSTLDLRDTLRSTITAKDAFGKLTVPTKVSALSVSDVAEPATEPVSGSGDGLCSNSGPSEGATATPREPLPAPAGPTVSELTLPAVCQGYGSIPGCSDANCAKVHICPHFLASACKRGKCPLGHRLTTDHNRKVLGRSGQLVTDLNHASLVTALYTASPHVQRTERYQCLRLCTGNNTNGCTAADCTFLHVCHKHIAGTCKLDTCAKGHNLKTAFNVAILVALGLRNAATDEVLEMMRAIYACPSLCGRTSSAKALCATAEAASPASGASLVSISTRVPLHDDSPSARTSAGRALLKELTLPSVCQRHCSRSGCKDLQCADVHICPHFLASSCRRQNCTLNHLLTNNHNRRALRLRGIDASKFSSDFLVSAMYTAPPQVRRTEVYQKMRVCNRLGSATGCTAVDCTMMHVCHKFVGGSCNQETCDRGHRVRVSRNMAKLAALGLLNAPEEEVLEMLRAIHSCPSVCG